MAETQSIEVDESGYPIGYVRVDSGDLPAIDFDSFKPVKIDKVTGAPASIRAVVGAARTPQDKLITVQQYYPDAEPYGDGNFIFMDPASGNETLFNPEGMDLGDISEAGRLAFEFVGGGIGGAIPAIVGQIPPATATPEEIFTVPLGVGMGTEIGGQVYDSFMGLINPVADSRTNRKMIVDAANNIGLNTVMHKGLENAFNAIKTQAGKATGAVNKTAQEVKQSFDRAGITAGLGDITQSQTLQNMQQALAVLPLSAEVIGKSAQETLKGLEDYASSVVRMATTQEPSMDVAGFNIRKGAEKYVNAFQDKASKFYKEADELIPLSTRVEPAALTKAVGEQLIRLGKTQRKGQRGTGLATGPESGAVYRPTETMMGAGGEIYTRGGDRITREGAGAAEEFADDLKGTAFETLFNSKLKNVLAGVIRESKEVALDPLTMTTPSKGITYGQLKAIRTKIGDMISDKALINDSTQAELKQLYAALSEDMTNAASSISPEALKKMERANRFWAYGRSQVDDVLQPITNKTQDAEVFKAAMRGTKDGVGYLKQLKGTLPKNEWDSLVGTQLQLLGRETAGASGDAVRGFSPNTFMTNYRALSDESKKVLFGGKRYGELRKSLDDLVTMSGALKETNKLVNNSNSARSLLYMSLMAGVLGTNIGEGVIVDVAQEGAKGIAGLGLSSLATAKLMTSPKFVDWMVEGLKKPVTEKNISLHLARLPAVAAADKSIAPEVEQFTAALRDYTSPEAVNE